MALHLEIDLFSPLRLNTKPKLLKAVATKVSDGCDDQEAFVNDVLTNAGKASGTALLAQDPILEAAFDDLDPDDKREHMNLDKQFKERRVRGSALVHKQALEVEALEAEPKPKRRAKRKASQGKGAKSRR